MRQREPIRNQGMSSLQRRRNDTSSAPEPPAPAEPETTEVNAAPILDNTTMCETLDRGEVPVDLRVSM